MNLDDPKLTAFALNELDEPERSTIARTVADSPEAQRVVDETREISRALKKEFEADFSHEGVLPRRLIDIRDDPWFWSIARPLAIAASIAIFAILGAVAIGTYRTRHDSSPAAADRMAYADVEGDEKPQAEAPSDFAGPKNIPNPLQAETIQLIQRVVIGELEVDPDSNNHEIRVIEVIDDAFRVQGLKNRLTTRILAKKPRQGLIGRTYELMFLDRNGRVVASAGFYRTPQLGFVLHPSKYGYERNGHYFTGRGDTPLPGNWDSDINYLGYVIPFRDWSECIGYSPSA